jgi:hypothetical protein
MIFALQIDPSQQRTVILGEDHPEFLANIILQEVEADSWIEAKSKLGIALTAEQARIAELLASNGGAARG